MWPLISNFYEKRYLKWNSRIIYQLFTFFLSLILRTDRLTDRVSDDKDLFATIMRLQSDFLVDI